MIQTKLTLFSWFGHGKPNNCHKFTKFKFEDTNVNNIGHIGFGYVCCFDTRKPGYGIWQAAEIQITRAHAGGFHFEQRRRDDTWLFV